MTDRVAPALRMAHDQYVKNTTPAWQRENTAALSSAIARCERELPGWWWSVGSCSISAHATIGPDTDGPDADMANIFGLDEGASADLSRPSTCADALNRCIDEALEIRRKHLLNKAL